MNYLNLRHRSLRSLYSAVKLFWLWYVSLYIGFSPLGHDLLYDPLLCYCCHNCGVAIETPKTVSQSSRLLDALA